jgi:hypothetical protein
MTLWFGVKRTSLYDRGQLGTDWLGCGICDLIFLFVRIAEIQPLRRVPCASVEYESFGETHYFYIHYVGLVSNVRLLEVALHGKSNTRLASAIQEIMESQR